MCGYHGIPVVKLDENKIRWIIKSKDDKIKNSDIADTLKITLRRVQQIYLQYKTTKNINTQNTRTSKKANYCAGDRTSQADPEKTSYKCVIS